jgi:NAD(P)-dependent dehydrogenase (short-subunit alcohol dehydrogenase family)
MLRKDDTTQVLERLSICVRDSELAVIQRVPMLGKGGLKMLTKNLATEWAKYNIQVNGIGPGYFAHAQTLQYAKTVIHTTDFIISRTPAARWESPKIFMEPQYF